MDHLSPDYAFAAEILVASAAICFGVVAAKLRYPSDEAQIRRGDCPECKARKSLRTTPISDHSVMFTCGDCASQWLVESLDEKMVVHGPASKPVLPPLRMTYDERSSSVVFETDVGIAAFDLLQIGISHRRAFLECHTPRQKLNFLYRTGIAPAKVDIAPNQVLYIQQAECTPYQWFAASAGVDIYYLMPRSAINFNGEKED